MLKQLVNEARLRLRITTTGPLLVKSGLPTVSGPDMAPVLTFRNGRQEPFLPGSSLKGVFRSHVEKIVTSLRTRVVCYPFAINKSAETKDSLEERRRTHRDSCGERFNREVRNDEQRRAQLEARTDEVYGRSCPVCRLFGSTWFIGRLAISDAYLVSSPILEQRDGVGIDRLTGGAAHGAKFELEVISEGVTFECGIHLRNFEIWQLGMLFVVLQDLEDGLIRLGSGRSRGLGWVKGTLSSEEHDGWPGGLVTATIRGSDAREPRDELWGLGRWLNEQPTSGEPGWGRYGTWYDDLVKLPAEIERLPRGIRHLRIFTGEALAQLREEAIQHFIRRIQEWPDESAQVPALAGGKRS
ncbi:type III CRISPR-associated RAMP protein Csx7 [Thermogemmatispora tikiterensis]|uniref:CRISPR-associated RAMP protein n=1 Tax=Thermogemmatispora tikiterensis TaxID=1825093 RepID=A0A328VJQ7_9CHLR|nr:CRISPR-associated RAMP protein Csx7 [Thermogemmatispora tikiterensis]RAQ96010.1 CRISPR-associated RAMP protein [Thermogemmatispora tikiterensis]